MKVEPDAKITEFETPPLGPKTLPVLFVPCVKTAPELKVMPLALAAVRLCVVEAAAEKVIDPLILPVVPAATLMLIALFALQLSAEPAATERPVPPPLIVSVTGLAACRFTVVLPETDNCPIV